MWPISWWFWKPRLRKLRWIIGPVGKHKTRIIVRGNKMSLVLVNTKKVPLGLQGADASGNPVVISGVPVWSVTDSTVLTLNPSADGLTCEAVAVGPAGSVRVTVEVSGLTATLDVQVTGGVLSSITIVPGEPVDK